MQCVTDLAAFLADHPPFDALTPQAREDLVAAGAVTDHESGEQLLDGFATGSSAVFVILSGQVELWKVDAGPGAPPDEIIGPGEIFGFSAVLSGAKIGPLAVAVGPVRLLRLPGDLVAPAFSSAAGIRFVVDQLYPTSPAHVDIPAYSTVDELIVTTPLVGPASLTVGEAARRMTEADQSYLAVGSPATGYRILTDRTIRQRVVAAGLPASTPIDEVVEPALTTAAGTLAATALAQLSESGSHYLLVTERDGQLRGVVIPQDFVVSPSSTALPLREQIGRARSADDLIALGGRLPALLRELMTAGRPAAEVTAIYSTVVDQMQRKALQLVLARHPTVDEGQITWLSLGSNGRREPVLASDIDSAVVLGPGVDSPATYREAFADTERLLRDAGLHVDSGGATPSSPSFSRTRAQWRAAALTWLNSPLDNKGMVMASLLLDGRPIQGDPALPVVREVFGDIRSHPGTFKLLLADSLMNRARLRSLRDVLARRAGTFDIKAHAVRPVVEIARWAAMAVHSAAETTRGRLNAASGSPMLPAEQAGILLEVFEVLQRLRLSYQLEQLERGDRPSNVVTMNRLSPLDRTALAQSVREIAAVQRRLTNLTQFTDPAEWSGR